MARTPLLPDDNDRASFRTERDENSEGVELQVLEDDAREITHTNVKRSSAPERAVLSSPCAPCKQEGITYVAYCILCFVVAAVLFSVTTWDVVMHHGRPKHWLRHLRPEEEALEAFVGGALLLETLVRLRYMGLRSFFSNVWRALDGIVVILTLVTWFILVLRRRLRAPVTEDDVEEADLPFLMARFALQPFRIISAVWMVRRARLLARQQRDEFEELLELGPLQSASKLLTQDLALQIAEHFTPSLRFSSWHLVYTPRMHGTSMQTFYKQQSGPNVIVLRDTKGIVLGGFASRPWQHSGNAYGSAESFVFSSREPLSGPRALEESEALERLDMLRPSIQVFHARPHHRGDVLQWSDDRMLAMGRAVVVQNQFLRGSSYSCDTYGSPELSNSGEDFVVQEFECWSIGA